MTSAQQEPSAHAPCTSTTLRATAGLAACAAASAAQSVAESMLMAITANFRCVFICRTLLSTIYTLIFAFGIFYIYRGQLGRIALAARDPQPTWAVTKFSSLPIYSE